VLGFVPGRQAWKQEADVDLKLMVWAKNALEYMFFAGLFGCCLTVLLSWISVGRDAISPDDDIEDKKVSVAAGAAHR
jgi:hypothetical protein